MLKKPDNVMLKFFTMNLSSWIPKCLSTSKIWSKGYCLSIEGYGEVSRFVLLSSFELHSVILCRIQKSVTKEPQLFSKTFPTSLPDLNLHHERNEKNTNPVECSWYFLNLSKVFAVFLFHNEWSNTQMLHLYWYHAKSA